MKILFTALLLMSSTVYARPCRIYTGTTYFQSATIVKLGHEVSSREDADYILDTEMQLFSHRGMFGVRALPAFGDRKVYFVSLKSTDQDTSTTIRRSYAACQVDWISKLERLECAPAWHSREQLSKVLNRNAARLLKRVSCN